jgi:FkbM family methyltransferase
VLPSLATFWLAPQTKLREDLPALLSVADLLADSASIKVFEQILAFRLTGDPLLHPAVQPHDQYRPHDFQKSNLAFPEPISFLDGGAYNGDTGLFLAKQGISLREWVAFEPDLTNFRDLVKNAAALPTTRRSFYPLGLSDSITDLCFDAQSASSSRFGEAGASVVRCVSIDGALAGFRPDYVKLDIEGAEDAALRGMAGTLSNARPNLAVSVYHKPNDQLVLTDRVREIMPEAQLYLRQHAESGFDTVLYAFT